MEEVITQLNPQETTGEKQNLAAVVYSWKIFEMRAVNDCTEKFKEGRENM